MLNPMQSSISVHRQRVIIVASVLLLHVLALWALQTGLLQRVLVLAEEIVVPVEFISPEVPPVIKPLPELPKPPPSTKTPVAALTPTPAQPVAPVPAPAPMPLAIADPTPSANAPVGVTHAPPVVAPAAAPVATPKVPPAARQEQHSSTARYLREPSPIHPLVSERRGEYGVVLLSVVVDVDGCPKSVIVKKSSGYERLDQAALRSIVGCIFVPDQRDGKPVESVVDAPIRFKPPE
jgi:protein TonB